MAGRHSHPPDRLTLVSRAAGAARDSKPKTTTVPELSVLRSTVRSDQITSEMEPDMIVDCDRCQMRGVACQDCVITVLLGAPPGGIELDGTERWALDTLAEVGMVPRLQLVDRHASRGTRQAEISRGDELRNSAERSANDGERSRRQVS